MSRPRLLVLSILATTALALSGFSGNKPTRPYLSLTEISPPGSGLTLSPPDSSKQEKKTKKLKPKKFKRPKVSKKTSMRKARRAKTSG